MIREKTISSRILSLKWKVLIGLSLLLLGIYSGFFLLGIQTLQQQQRAQFDLMTQRFANSLDHVLATKTAMWSNLVDMLAYDQSDLDAVQTRIIEQWPLLQREWELQSVALIDAGQNIHSVFGKPLALSAPIPLAVNAGKSGQPVSKFSCTSTSFDSNCSLITALPLHMHNGGGILLISIPITDLILNLSRANLIDAAVLIRERQISSVSIEKWRLNVAAASDLDTAFDLLQAASAKITVPDLIKSGMQIGVEDRRYYIRAIGTDKVDNNANLLIVLIDDITVQHRALAQRWRQIAAAALIAMIISEIFLLLILWQPMERIKWQAEVLPLLAEGDYHSVYSGPAYRNVRYRDELDILEDASMLLAKKLEKMGIEIRKRSSELEYLALYDTLTGLGNRHSLEYSLAAAIAEYERSQRGFALLFIDLDNFKRINDSLGHDIGDNLLIEIGRRLRAITRSEDAIARLGGDEFVIILRNIAASRAVIEAAQKILHTLREPIALTQHRLHVSGSIGITLAPIDGLDAATLMKNADLAMYRAKSLGRNTYQFFTSVISDSAKRMLELEIELENAFNRNEFVLFYQPIVELTSGRVVGLEALARWKHPMRGLVPPAEFVPAMEISGMIAQLDRQVIRLACRDLNFLRTQTGCDLTISINLSSNQLRDSALATFLQEQLALADAQPRHLKIEITESVLMEDVDNAVLVLRQLKTLGVKLAIDDFGTGYSSLNYLKKLPVDELKIDHSFVCDTPDEISSTEIVAAVIAMSHKLNLKVVAEGIENSEQLDFLLNCRCDFGQGYYFERPLARDSIVAWLQRFGSRARRHEVLAIEEQGR